MGRVTTTLLYLSIWVAGAANPAAQATPPDGSRSPPPCTLQAGETHTVVRVIDAETIELDNGSTARLVGALPPIRPAFISGAAVWPPQAAAREALSELLQGRPVELAYAPQGRLDRWGRHMAHAFVLDGAGREWVQGYMLRNGHARVDTAPGAVACFAEMLAHEAEARTAALGLWGHPHYRPRWAGAPQRLMRLRNTFQQVEGRVQAVTLTRARIYINFGTDWRTDFTAGASLRANEFKDQHTIAELKKLEGRRVRVRGWIERRNGPFVELVHPRQIEVTDDEALPPSAGLGGRAAPAQVGVPADAAPRDDDARNDSEKRPEREAPGVHDL